MKYLSVLLALGSLLAFPGAAKAGDKVVHEGIVFEQFKISTYQFTKLTPQHVFHMPYAKYEMAEAEIERWRRISPKVVPFEIDMVFTLYPEDISRWRTNYYELIKDRLQTLFEIDSTLRTNDIRWNMVLQTDCKTEEEAKDFFHGFVVKFRPREVHMVDELKTPRELRSLIQGTVVPKDSTVIKILERNPQWNNMMVVTDWTGSMYQYGAQLVLWHKLQLSTQQTRVKHFVFFNDGNNRKNSYKVVGKTGGIYYSKSGDIIELLKTMELVMKRGDGGDAPENDLEALLTGIQHLKDYGEVVLIADNKSDVRDMALLSRLDVPVRIILCDVQKNLIHPSYIRIALKSGGSLHTLDKDIYDVAQFLEERRSAFHKEN